MSVAAHAPQPFSAHLYELRDRTLFVALSLIAGTIAGYTLHEHLTALLVAPLNQTLYYSSPAGGFEFTLKVSLFFGLLVSIPTLTYQVLRFLSPLLPQDTTASAFKLLAASCTLMALGASFAYFVSLPAALHFLSQFGSEGVASLISTTEYFSFVTRYVLGFGLLFQVPLVVLVINSISRLEAHTLFKQQRWVILVSFIVAAILTPTPDVFNQALMAIPIIVLYQIAVLGVWVVNRRTNRRTT